MNAVALKLQILLIYQPATLRPKPESTLHLRESLLKSFGISRRERAARHLGIPRLLYHKPSILLSEMRSLNVRSYRVYIIFVEMLFRQLHDDIRLQLAHLDITDLDILGEHFGQKPGIVERYVNTRRILSAPNSEQSESIIGADFLRRQNLLVYDKGRRVFDPETYLSFHCTLTRASHIHMRNASLKKERLPFSFGEHSRDHYKQNSQQTTSSTKDRLLSRDKLTVAKTECIIIDELGIIRRSKRRCSSPLTIVPKQSGDYRPCIISLPEKVEAICSFPEPISKKELQQFYCMINHNHRYIAAVENLMKPLHSALLNKSKSVVWSEEMDMTFRKVMEAPAKATFLVFSESNAPLALTTNASIIAVELF
ncbi:hypothetical protein RF11_09514 [Thelohanellus kitauei]|uniref:Reverse transcriptase/retrotransposon-derived protein RNase H-like domain-containing protein n=1 Tax=Thelohanellus kitauei TaxID=669202 RepID=A0A0C2ISX8_THEKT|nr:hypothetical protein RF11_09514 [Thelohanellus kitauei]